MGENLNGVDSMASQPSQKKLTTSSYLVEAELDKEWEQGRQQATAQPDSGSSETKARTS